jgi:hypothetical protein
MVCVVYRLARSTVYARLGRLGRGALVARRRPGPETEWTDEEVLLGIGEVLRGSGS